MHARWGSLQVLPGRVDEFVRIFRDSMLPAARAQKGFKGVFMLTIRDSGKVVAASLWESEADARAVETSSGSFSAQADAVRDIVTEMPVIEYYEVVVESTASEEPKATSARVSYRQLQPDKMDEAIRTYRETVVPAANVQPGGTGGFILANRSADKIISIRLWASEADRSASQPPGDVDPSDASPIVRELYDVAFQVSH